MSEHTPEPWSTGPTHVIARRYQDDKDRRVTQFVAETFGRAGHEDLGRAEQEANARRIVACVNTCKGISTDRLEKMIPGTLANLLTITGARDQLTEARIAEIIDKRMIKACYDPMGKEIAALITKANLLTLKGDRA